MTMSYSSIFGENNLDLKSKELSQVKEVHSTIMKDIKTECDSDDFEDNYKVNMQDIISQVAPVPSDDELILSKKNPSGGNTQNTLDRPVKLETIYVNGNVKEEFVNTVCDSCGEEYEMYCLKCQMLLRVLDSTVPLAVYNNPKQTIPKDILYLDDSRGDAGVFALNAIPKEVIFGPFEGLDLLFNETGAICQVNRQKLVLKQASSTYSNWMRFVNCAKHILQQNLTLFQHKARLYFRTRSEISAGEELLIYFGDECESKLKDDKITYFNPIIEETLESVYACTYCCLGFSSERHLLKHKSRCRIGIDTKCLSEDIVQCQYCDVHLMKMEYSEYHLDYCCTKCARTGDGGSGQGPVPAPVEASPKPKFTYLTCDKVFSRKSCLNTHVRVHHTDKETFGCVKCPFQTIHKHNLQTHMNTVHSAAAAKPFRCEHCPYQTAVEINLKRHATVHDAVKPFRCGRCEKAFSRNYVLMQHVRDKHSATDAKKYRCDECGYQTNCKTIYGYHANKHAAVKPIVCATCGKRFAWKNALEKHVLAHHTTDEDKLKCPACPYVTSRRYLLRRHHLRVHADPEPFSCESCRAEFTEKRDLERHKRTVHAEVSDQGGGGRRRRKTSHAIAKMRKKKRPFV